MAKGFIMSGTLIVFLLMLLALIVYRFCIIKTPEINDPTHGVPEQLKNEINAYYGKAVIARIAVESVGYGFEGSEQNSLEERNPTYMITAHVILGNRETCFYSLIEDISPIGVHLSANYFIQKINNFKSNIRTSC